MNTKTTNFQKQNSKVSGPGIFKRKIEPLLDKLTRSVVDSTIVKAQIEDELLSGWKKVLFSQHEKGMLLTITTTNKCTLKCNHCFEEAGPENNLFLDKNRIDKLAEESIDLFKQYSSKEIRITGGDPLLHPDIYQIIDSFSRRKNLLGYSTLDIETNGWWATDNIKTGDIVMKLKESGATLLSMTVDYWHKKGRVFPNDEHFDRIEKASEIVGLEFRHINVSFPLAIKGEDDFIPEVTPIGRGRKLPEKYWGSHMSCRARGCRLTPPTQAIAPGYSPIDEITIGSNGNVYPCNSGKEFEHASLALGNIYEKPLADIVKEENKIVETIRERGLRALTKTVGLSLWGHWKMYDKFSPCGLCHEMLRKNGKEITERLQKNQKSIYQKLNLESKKLRIISLPIVLIFRKKIVEYLPKILRGSLPS